MDVLILLWLLHDKIIRISRWRGVSSQLRWAFWKSRLAALGDDTILFPNVIIHQPEKVSIGSRCSIAEFVHVWGGGRVTIGDDVLIASHVVITSLTHDTEARVFAATSVKEPVTIEDNVWIGAGAVIMPGVTLASGCVVGAGAVVTRDVAPNSIVAGSPAHAMRLRGMPPG